MQVINRQMVSLFQGCHKKWFSWEWTVSNTTSSPLASIPDRIRNWLKLSANAKNQLHEKEEIWILANYHLHIGIGDTFGKWVTRQNVA